MTSEHDRALSAAVVAFVAQMERLEAPKNGWAVNGDDYIVQALARGGDDEDHSDVILLVARPSADYTFLMCFKVEGDLYHYYVDTVGEVAKGGGWTLQFVLDACRQTLVHAVIEANRNARTKE